VGRSADYLHRRHLHIPVGMNLRDTLPSPRLPDTNPVGIAAGSSPAAVGTNRAAKHRPGVTEVHTTVAAGG